MSPDHVDNRGRGEEYPLAPEISIKSLNDPQDDDKTGMVIAIKTIMLWRGNLSNCPRGFTTLVPRPLGK